MQFRTVWISGQFPVTQKAVFLLQRVEKNMTPTQLLYFRDFIAFRFLCWEGILAFHFSEVPGKGMLLHIYY